MNLRKVFHGGLKYGNLDSTELSADYLMFGANCPQNAAQRTGCKCLSYNQLQTQKNRLWKSFFVLETV
jgi:hypothetical protein